VNPARPGREQRYQSSLGVGATRAERAWPVGFSGAHITFGL
jgi:hypothetical protein